MRGETPQHALPHRSIPGATLQRGGLAALSALLLGCGGCVPPPTAHLAAPVPRGLHVALLPLANYSATSNAPQRIAPMLAVELAAQRNLQIIDAGTVQAVLDEEPWMVLDRLPPDLVDRFGAALGADALLIGSILSFDYRESNGERIPHISLTLRLLETPGGRILWSAVHNRDGADGEWFFGFGRVQNLEQLTMQVVTEMVQSFPGAPALPGATGPARPDAQQGEEP